MKVVHLFELLKGAVDFYYWLKRNKSTVAFVL
jgi:hypothetical protein